MSDLSSVVEQISKAEAEAEKHCSLCNDQGCEICDEGYQADMAAYRREQFHHDVDDIDIIDPPDDLPIKEEDDDFYDDWEEEQEEEEEPYDQSDDNEYDDDSPLAHWDDEDF